jgi:membrane protease YdiL (CAAX protease family)
MIPEHGSPTIPAKPPTRALQLSVAVILLYWASTLAQTLLRPEPPSLPPTMQDLALRVALRSALVLGVAWVLLRATRESFVTLGLKPEGFRSLGGGILFGVGVFVLVNIVLNVAIRVALAVLKVPAGGGVSALFQHRSDWPYWLFAAVVGGGLTEEVERAFILTRLEGLFGRRALGFAVAVDVFMFGFAHLYQGLAGAMLAGCAGLAFALIFLRRRRVWDAVVAHAVYDLIGVVIAFVMYAGAGGSQPPAR